MEQKDTVAARNSGYWESHEKREIYRDVYAGTLKLREKCGEYLPKFPAETDADYQYRVETATCFNMTAKTANVMTGLVFRNPIHLEDDVDPEIRLLWENIDNAGTHGDVFCRRVFEASLEGCSVILVDAPMAEAVSREDQIRMGLRPYWVLYTAENVWNWRFQINPVSKRKELSMIVLREIGTEATGEFTSEPVCRFRVFRFDGQIVTWALYRETRTESGKTEYVVEGEGILPELSQIPVAVVGGFGADPLLLDIALKNIEHFQTYSDYKSLIHKTCVPIPVAKGLETGGNANMTIGGSTLIQTSAQGDFRFSEVAGSSLNVVRQTLVDNREEIALMGLSLLADKTAKVDITATEALLNSVAETSELRILARSLQDAIELALGHTAEYLQLPRVMGGSIDLGTAWQDEMSKYQISLEELNKRADIANKLTGIMSQEWILAFLGVEDEDEMRDILNQIASQDVLIQPDAPEYQMPELSAGQPDGEPAQLID